MQQQLKAWALFALGVAVGWFLAAVIVPALIVGTFVLALLRGVDRIREAMERMGEEFSSTVREANGE